jgi:hypothetical protein
MFIDYDSEQQFGNSNRSSYEVTYDDDSTETISAIDAYVDGDFMLFIDFAGLVAARDSSTVVAVDRMS